MPENPLSVLPCDSRAQQEWEPGLQFSTGAASRCQGLEESEGLEATGRLLAKQTAELPCLLHLQEPQVGRHQILQLGEVFMWGHCSKSC